MTSNQVNNQANNIQSVFDPNNLPPEFVSYVDQQRTQASQTARANARKDLMKDETFLNEVRNSMQPGVQKSVEDQLADLRRETMIDRASAKVERILSQAGIPEESAAVYMGLLVSDNVEDSVNKANAFVSTLNKTVGDAVSAQQVNAMQTMTTPQNTPNPVSEAERLQAEFDEVKKSNDYQKGIKMSNLIRQAQAQGIVLR